jgi:hypothetical protein
MQQSTGDHQALFYAPREITGGFLGSSFQVHQRQNFIDTAKRQVVQPAIEAQVIVRREALV